MIRLPLDIAACYEAMRERAAKNANFDLLGFIRKRMVQVTEKEKTKIKGTMTDEEKVKLVAEVMQGFDFEKTRKMMMPSKAKVSICELKVIARNLLFMCLEHQDREFWWAGGMHRGGLCACYDDKYGLSLNYIAVANKVRISKDKEL